MSKYIKHEINYHHPYIDTVTIKEYGVDLGKCPTCGLDAVIVEYAGIGWVGCPLSHMVYCGNRHPCTGYNGKTCTRKPIADIHTCRSRKARRKAGYLKKEVPAVSALLVRFYNKLSKIL